MGQRWGMAAWDGDVSMLRLFLVTVLPQMGGLVLMMKD
jgi:hypothetical protein